MGKYFIAAAAVAAMGAYTPASAIPAPAVNAFDAFCSAFSSTPGGASGANDCGVQVNAGADGVVVGQPYNPAARSADAENEIGGNDSAAVVNAILGLTGADALSLLARDNNGGSDVTTFGTLTFSVSQTARNGRTETKRAQGGSWIFTPSTIPAYKVTHIAAKGSNGFTLWSVLSDSGFWSTEGLSAGNASSPNFPDLSHLTAYGVKVDSPAPIPLPAAAWLLLSGLGGLGALGVAGRKRRAA